VKNNGAVSYFDFGATGLGGYLSGWPRECLFELEAGDPGNPEFEAWELEPGELLVSEEFVAVLPGEE